MEIRNTHEVALCKRYINYNLAMLLELDAFVISPVGCARERISGSLQKVGSGCRIVCSVVRASKQQGYATEECAPCGMMLARGERGFATSGGLKILRSGKI
jgi:hypothetical protein